MHLHERIDAGISVMFRTMPADQKFNFYMPRSEFLSLLNLSMLVRGHMKMPELAPAKLRVGNAAIRFPACSQFLQRSNSMKKNNLFLLLSAVSCIALAQPAAPSASSTGMQPKTENGVTYLCGGVGLDESTAMKEAARNYDLMSTFAAQDGSYLADVKVDILDSHGATILHTNCGGPMMLIKLPRAGTYRLRAEIGGNTQTKTATVGSGHKTGTPRLVFVWPAAQAGLEQPRPKEPQ